MSEVNILYGPPGSGKTTAADLLPRSIAYLSVGRLARKEFENQTILGCQMHDLIEHLEEYPKPVIQELMEAPIKSANGIILLDGFPKYEREIEVLENIMEAGDLLPGDLFNIELDLSTAWDRIKGRKICPLCDYQSSELRECPNCNKTLLKRVDDNYEDFAIRYNDYETNNSLVKVKLIKLGFKAIELVNGTPKSYCDIIADSLLNHARVAQKRERLVRFQKVDS
jgi:adenylate kinase